MGARFWLMETSPDPLGSLFGFHPHPSSLILSLLPNPLNAQHNPLELPIPSAASWDLAEDGRLVSDCNRGPGAGAFLAVERGRRGVGNYFVS